MSRALNRIVSLYLCNGINPILLSEAASVLTSGRVCLIIRFPFKISYQSMGKRAIPNYCLDFFLTKRYKKKKKKTI